MGKTAENWYLLLPHFCRYVGAPMTLKLTILEVSCDVYTRYVVLYLNEIWENGKRIEGEIAVMSMDSISSTCLFLPLKMIALLVLINCEIPLNIILFWFACQLFVVFKVKYHGIVMVIVGKLLFALLPSSASRNCLISHKLGKKPRWGLTSYPIFCPLQQVIRWFRSVILYPCLSDCLFSVHKLYLPVELYKVNMSY